ncbi:hypothetical protein AAZX31_15G112300 [Glycine max]
MKTLQAPRFPFESLNTPPCCRSISLLPTTILVFKNPNPKRLRGIYQPPSQLHDESFIRFMQVAKSQPAIPLGATKLLPRYFRHAIPHNFSNQHFQIMTNIFR